MLCMYNRVMFIILNVDVAIFYTFDSFVVSIYFMNGLDCIKKFL